MSCGAESFEVICISILFGVQCGFICVQKRLKCAFCGRIFNFIDQILHIVLRITHRTGSAESLLLTLWTHLDILVKGHSLWLLRFDSGVFHRAHQGIEGIVSCGAESFEIIFICILFGVQCGFICVQERLKCVFWVGVGDVVNQLLQISARVAHRRHLSIHILSGYVAHRGHLAESAAILSVHALTELLTLLHTAHRRHLHSLTGSLSANCGEGYDRHDEDNNAHHDFIHCVFICNSIHFLFFLSFHRFFYPAAYICGSWFWKKGVR